MAQAIRYLPGYIDDEGIQHKTDRHIIHLKDVIIEMYDDVLEDILMHNHVHYTFAGGRGSTKSSFVAIAIILLIIQNTEVNAVCFRKVGNTIQNSIYSQIIWAIYELGLDTLFHIPKTYSNPIVYLPTGQRIFFMGMDSPDKVKSVKTARGYIGITWWEELDQFAGEAELRKVLQSTMRGGAKFWDFRTFNPPISVDNWANEYAEEAESFTHTMVIRNTYLDVPVDWLGPQFIQEAEDLKERNERAYLHEYMGMAIGTGGSVFPNACDLDMDKSIPIWSNAHNQEELVPMWKTFDNIFNGIDWGFALDPFRFVRMHLDVRRLDLYIFAEYDAVSERNVITFEKLYKELNLIKYNELVTADSAEPKSIADFKAYGAYIRPAEKGPDSVRYGIKWLQSLNHIYIDKRKCPKTYKEFTHYEYCQDGNGNFISEYPDKDNHGIDACLTGDTLIHTPNGNIRIEDMVNTENSIYAYDINTKQVVIADYINCRMTYEEAEIWEVELEDGRIIECTYDHKILTSNRGYVMACELTEYDDIVCVY